MAHGIRLRVWGPSACFTRPEMSVERVSYDTMTPSAARGILEAVYWKPQIEWVVTAIHTLAPPRFITIRTNGVSSKIAVKGATGASSAMKAGRGRLGLYADEDRQQFAAMVLGGHDGQSIGWRQGCRAHSASSRAGQAHEPAARRARARPTRSKL